MEGNTSTPHPSPDAVAAGPKTPPGSAAEAASGSRAPSTAAEATLAAGPPSVAAEATPAVRSPSANAATAANGSQSPGNGGESPVVAPGFTPVDPSQPADSAELASPEAKPVTPGLAAMEADPRRTHREWRPLYGRVTKCDSCDGRSPGVLQECCDKRCSVRFCEGCARGNLWHSQHRTHFIDADKCDWTIRKQPMKPRRTAPRARPARRSSGSGSGSAAQPASRKRRVHFEDEEDDENEEDEERRPAKRVQYEAPRQHTQPPVHPAYHQQPPVIGRTPLPSMAPPRRTTGPSPLRYLESYTRESTSQVNWTAAETAQLASAAVRGFGRRETNGYTFQTPPMPPRRQEAPRHSKRWTSQSQGYMSVAPRENPPQGYVSAPPREYQPTRSSASMMPPPGNNRPENRPAHGTGYRAVDGPSEQAPAQPPVQSQPTPLSSAEIRQVKSLYNVIVGTDYTGNFRTYIRPPIPDQLVPVLARPPASHHIIHNDVHILSCVRRAWHSNDEVATLRKFHDDSTLLNLFWDVFNLYCMENSVHDNPNATNWFVGKKKDADFEIQRAARMELVAKREAERQEWERQRREWEERRPGGAGY